jgi:cytochrome c553
MISTTTRASISILVGALLFSPAVYAEHQIPETISVELQFKPDVINGKRVYAVCASCHLPDGWGNHDGVYPQLSGQHATVLMKQLLDIREGRRDNPSMFPFVQERTVGGYQNLADVVAYISTLPRANACSRKSAWTAMVIKRREIPMQKYLDCKASIMLIWCSRRVPL